MNNDQHLFDLNIDQQSSSLLSETARWGKFLAIVGFVLCLLMVLLSYFAGAMIASQLPSTTAGIGGGVLTFGYILFALLWFFPCLYLYQFSVKMQSAIRRNDQVLLHTAFKNLKSCFKFIGIVTLVIISFYVIVILLTMVSLF